MSFVLAAGTQAAVASTYASAVNMTAITNAAAAVATLAAGHGVVVGDLLEITSGWARLNGRIVRVSAVATNDVTLEGINTSNTAHFPVGQGVGTIRRITGWHNITPALSLAVSGGEAQMVDITSIEDVTERKLPGRGGAVEVEIEASFVPSATWYATLAAARDAGLPAAVRLVFPNGSRMLGNGYWFLDYAPKVEKNDVLKVNAKCSLLATPTNYAS